MRREVPNNRRRNRLILAIIVITLTTVIACTAKKRDSIDKKAPESKYRAHELYYGTTDNAVNAMRATVAAEMQVVSQMLENKITVTADDVIRMVEISAENYAIAAPEGFSFRSQRAEAVNNGTTVNGDDSQTATGDRGASSAAIPDPPVVKSVSEKRPSLFDMDEPQSPSPTPKKSCPLKKKDKNMTKLPGLSQR